MTRDLFWFVAGLMSAAAAMLIAVPLFASRRTETGPGLRLGLLIGAVAIVGLGAATLALYRAVGTPSAVGAGGAETTASGQAPGSVPATGPAMKAPSMEDATARLADRLAREGGTSADWELLAQSYEFLGRAKDAAAARARAAAIPEGGEAASAGAPISATGEVRIEGSVDVAPTLRGRVNPDDTLFIYAREAGAAGPPVAVLRLGVDRWPVSFALDDRNSMIPGRDLSHAATVVLEARISRSGNAIAQAGDLVGTVEMVNPRAGRKIHIVIDHVH